MKKLKRLIPILTLAVVLSGVALVVAALASPSVAVAQAEAKPAAEGSSDNNGCGENFVRVSVPVEGGKDCIPANDQDANLANNPIVVYLKLFLRFLSGIVGLVVVLMIIVSGIQYMSSSGNPQGVQEARKHLGRAVTSLLLFIFAFAILNFLVPGGILG